MRTLALWLVLSAVAGGPFALSAWLVRHFVGCSWTEAAVIVLALDWCLERGTRIMRMFFL